MFVHFEAYILRNLALTLVITMHHMLLWQSLYYNSRGLPVQYGSTKPSPLAERVNKLRHVISGSGSSKGQAPISLCQDCNVYIGELEPSISVTYQLAAGRQAYTICIEGEVSHS
jgi:redox-sensitive bicupin YhaK (pirin superfamily)